MHSQERCITDSYTGTTPQESSPSADRPSPPIAVTTHGIYHNESLLYLKKRGKHISCKKPNQDNNSENEDNSPEDPADRLPKRGGCHAAVCDPVPAGIFMAVRAYACTVRNQFMAVSAHADLLSVPYRVNSNQGHYF